MQNTNITNWSDKITLIQKCTPKEAIPRQLNLLGSLIAQDTSLSESDKTVLRKIWQDAFNAYKKKASDTNADTIIEKIKHIEGITIEICGTWLWVSGDTKPHKDFLNDVGLTWAGAKKVWYWKPQETKTTNFKSKSVDMGYIREKYGREVIKAVS